MPRRVNIVILCEDTQQGVFANRFLELAGKSIRVMRIEKGPGEAFVRKQFPKELAYYRARKHKVDQALIVIIDADTLGVTKRVKQLEAAISEAGQDPRGVDERVALFVPARNIETWIAYLDGQTVNESDPYPKLRLESDCRRAVRCLHDMCQRNALREPAPPSLKQACDEYRSRLGRQI
ncbi:MAG: hypothetical protein GX604_00155 [Actinobacteria bacterium]|nr:hypothetical protein [Actinomycetota bacterium]